MALVSWAFARVGVHRPSLRLPYLAYLPTCLMYSTGCPSSSGSYSVLVPWSGGVSWVLLRPTSEIFAVPPRAQEVAVHSAHRNRGYSLFLLLVYLHNPGPCILGGW